MIWHSQGCLTMDPAQRLTCSDLLSHPYMDPHKDIYDRNSDDHKAIENTKKRHMNRKSQGVSFLRSLHDRRFCP